MPRKTFQKAFSWLSGLASSLFFTGLVTILPLAATIAFVRIVYQVLTSLLAPIRALEPSFLQEIPGSEIGLCLVLLFIIGALVHYFFLGILINGIEHGIKKIPVVRVIYSGIKTLIDFFNLPNHPEFKRKVVLVPFPHKEVYSVAFLVGEGQAFTPFLKEHSPQLQEPERYFKIFLPTTHMTIGYFMLIPEKDVIHTNISFEEAIKSIVSCGLINPSYKIEDTHLHHLQK